MQTAELITITKQAGNKNPANIKDYTMNNLQTSPRPLQTREQYKNEQAEIDPTKPRYFVRDKFGIERELPQKNFQPQNDEQIRYIVRARNITIIRKLGNSTKEFTPKSQIKLQAFIINSFEILHEQQDWITVRQIQNHLEKSLQITETTEKITTELRNIYQKAKAKRNKVICEHRESPETGKLEFQIRLRQPQ